MPKTRDQKVAHLAELEALLASAKGAVFAKYQGLKVAEMEGLRDAGGEQALTLRVTKNNILRIALRKHQIAIDETILDQPLVLLVSTTDEVAPAKLAKSFGKGHEALQIAGGLLDRHFLTATETRNLADLPSQDQLRAQLVGLLAAPLSGLVRTLQAPMAGLVSVLQQYATSRN